MTTTAPVIGQTQHDHALTIIAERNRAQGKAPDDYDVDTYMGALEEAEDEVSASDSEGTRSLVAETLREAGFQEPEGPEAEILARAHEICAEQGVTQPSSDELKDGILIALVYEKPPSQAAVLAKQFGLQGSLGPSKDVVLATAERSGVIRASERSLWSKTFDSNPVITTRVLVAQGLRLPPGVDLPEPTHILAHAAERRAVADLQSRDPDAPRLRMKGADEHVAAMAVLAEKGLDEDYTDRQYFAALEEVQARAARAAREAEERDAA